MDNSHFITRDTALAAWLDSQGFELLNTQKEAQGFAFIFENGNPRLKEFVRDFQCGRAEGNILLFYQSYKRMLRKVKVGQLS